MNLDEKKIDADENAVCKRKLHWINFIVPIIAPWLVLYFYGSLFPAPYFDSSLVVPGIVFCGLGSYVILIYRYFIVKIWVTHSRIFVRRGVFSWRRIEIFPSQIKAINVQQSLLGRVFNYGEFQMVSLFGKRVENDRYKISKPFELKKEIDALIEKNIIDDKETSFKSGCNSGDTIDLQKYPWQLVSCLGLFVVGGLLFFYLIPFLDFKERSITIGLSEIKGVYLSSKKIDFEVLVVNGDFKYKSIYLNPKGELIINKGRWNYYKNGEGLDKYSGIQFNSLEELPLQIIERKNNKSNRQFRGVGYFRRKILGKLKICFELKKSPFCYIKQ